MRESTAGSGLLVSSTEAYSTQGFWRNVDPFGISMAYIKARERRRARLQDRTLEKDARLAEQRMWHGRTRVSV